MIAIRGIGSLVAQQLVTLIDDDHVAIDRGVTDYPIVDRYLFCQGLMIGKRELTHDELIESYEVNFWYIARSIQLILQSNPKARICCIGSESVYRGSFDQTYATAKRHLHDFVVRTPIKPQQQLVCVSPGIIRDAGMTMARRDTDRLADRMNSHPKRRFLTSLEVARAVHFLLYVDEGYISNTVLRMNGGDSQC